MGFFDRLFRKEEDSDFSQSSMPAVNQVAAETVLLMSTDPRARLDAVNALGLTNSPRVVPTLAKTLREDETERIRGMCAGYLGSIKGDQTEEALLEVTGDPSPYVRRRAIEGLFRIGSERSLEAVRAALGDSDPIVKAKAQLFTEKMASPIKDRHCPHLTKFGMCDMPSCEFNECDWETENRGRYKKCPRFKED